MTPLLSLQGSSGLTKSESHPIFNCVKPHFWRTVRLRQLVHSYAECLLYSLHSVVGVRPTWVFKVKFSVFSNFFFHIRLERVSRGSQGWDHPNRFWSRRTSIRSSSWHLLCCLTSWKAKFDSSYGGSTRLNLFGIHITEISFRGIVFSWESQGTNCTTVSQAS